MSACNAHVLEPGALRCSLCGVADWPTVMAEITHLKGRLEAVREYVDDPGNWSALDGRRIHLLRLIDGEQ